MFNRLKIGKRITLIFVLILSFVLIVGLVTTVGMSVTTNRFQNFTENEVMANLSVKESIIAINVVATSLRDMCLNLSNENDSEYEQEISTNFTSIDKSLTKIRRSFKGESALIDKYISEISEWRIVAEEILNHVMQNQDDVATKLLLDECTPALNKIIQTSNQISQICEQIQMDSIKDNVTYSRNVRILVYIVLVIAILLTILVSTRISKAIVQPIEMLEKAAKEMEKGNLGYPIEYTSSNEIGSLANSLRASSKKIKDYIIDIDRAMQEMSNGNFDLQASQKFEGDFKNIEKSIDKYTIKMSQTLLEVGESAEQVASGSEQVSVGAQALSSGATEQASVIEEFSTTILNISTQVKNNAKYAISISEDATKVGNELETSNVQMQEMVNAIQAINEKSNEISKIIQTIDDIAFQTNILALNAAVEAARAGEAGKGFAVVADEVRNLASKSAEAAKNTAELIEDSVKAVVVGTDIADKTAKAMACVLEETRNIVITIDQVAKSSTEQATAIDQINIGIDQISAVIQNNSATSEQSAFASEELSIQAKTMKKLISNFILKDLRAKNTIQIDNTFDSNSYYSPRNSNDFDDSGYSKY